jgi:hypothetical protein
MRAACSLRRCYHNDVAVARRCRSSYLRNDVRRHQQARVQGLAEWAWPDRGPEAADKAAFLAREHVLGSLARALHDARLEALLVKGCGLAHLYPSPWLRPMADVDLLVRERELDRVVSVLSAAGFTREPDGRPLTASLLEISLRSPGQQLLVELHLSMDKVVLRPLDVGAMFDRSTTSNHGEALRVPSLEDQVLLVVLHFAADEYQHAAAVVDLELLVRHGAKLEEVVERARKVGATSALHLALAILCARAGEQVVSEDVLASLAPTGLRRRLLATQFDPTTWPVARHGSTLGPRWLLKQLLLQDSTASFGKGLAAYAIKRLLERVS